MAASLLSAAACLTAPAVADAAHGQVPTCGAVVTVSTVLTGDLRGCPGDGLVVGADGITIDLGGHTVSGDGTPGTTSVDTAVRVAGRHGVAVRNGRLTGFDRGVAVIDSDHVTVVGIAGSGMSRSVIYLSGTVSSVVKANATWATDVGIYLTNESAHNSVSGNHAWNNEQGITFDGANDNAMTANVINDNAGNVILLGDRNVVARNVVGHAVGCGGECGYGISLETGNDNQIVGNLIVDNLLDGIRVSNFFPDRAADRNVVRGNVVTGSTRDGIADGVEGERATSHTLIVGNLVSGNAGTGVHLAGSSATVKANTALRNGGHGIDAASGTEDGGGNKASANRTRPNCIGVVCTPA